MTNGPDRSFHTTPDRPYQEFLASFVARIQAFRPPEKPITVAQIVRDAYAPIREMFARGGTDEDIAQLLTLEGLSAKRDAVRTAWRRISDDLKTTPADTNVAEAVLSSPTIEAVEVDPDSEPQRPSDKPPEASIARHLE